MSGFKDMAAGLKTRLETVVGLMVYDHPPDVVNSFPAAIILPEPLDPEMVLDDSFWTARFRAVFLVASGEDSAGFSSLYSLLKPGASAGPIQAIRQGRTLGGAADDCDAVAVENIGRRELWGNLYFGFDLVVEALKST